MSTDILIPLGFGSRQNNLELRYCLRSIEKHLKNVGEVIVIGDNPGFLNLNLGSSCYFIPIKESANNWNRAKNIYNKILNGISIHKSLSDNFLFMNDDHFLLSDYDAGRFPYYNRGVINLENFKNNQPQYRQMKNTIDRLSGDLYDFDVHCPMVMNKERLEFVFKDLNWPEYGYGIKSMYGNSILDTTNWVPCEDLKFKEPLMKESIYEVLEGRQWFSVGDRCLKSGDMKQVLNELFPNPSKYEL